METIIEYLKSINKQISTMESCSGGYLASCITNISGSSLVFKFGAVTYSNDFKIKMGVDEELIKKYGVYSIECAKAMSKAISLYTRSSYGVGITGTIKDKDPFNESIDNHTIYLSIYDRENDKYYTKKINTINDTRIANKELIKNEFISLFKDNIIK